ncbi:hypothetical protein ABRY23_13940 [Melioribacteraceae bacterium 4301-Me]|uniref:hypothetical protein n=1 Tax=Pyranulibacter aquaticus TaxID=3163344 RepID=UPI003599779E
MENKFREPIYILALTIILLYLASFIKIDFQFWGIQLKNVDIFSDIKSELTTSWEEPQIDFQNKLNSPPENNKLAKDLLASNKIDQSLNNNINYAAFNFFSPETKTDALFISYNPQGKEEDITGNVQQLSNFFRALKNSNSQIVRVAHFGDSAIEGDLITADIREILQSKFGGSAVGWLGIVSQDVSFRMTTKHTFSDNWESASLYTSNPLGLPLGISGECNIPKGNAWVSYETTRFRRNLKDFNQVRLFYSHAKNSQIYYSFDNGPKQTAVLKPGDDIQQLILKPERNAHLVKFEFPIKDQAYLYGVSLENNPGVYVDNFPLRGNSGVDLQKIDVNVLKQFGKYLDYKLIIFEFGMNIAGTSRTDYSWYNREMVKVINNFKTAFPQASFLLIGVHDKAMKKGSSFVTDPTILRLLDAQKNIAKETNIAYWSLFEAMGGENSMSAWVNANPPMAFKDYIHFNEQGAKKVATLLTDALIKEYNKFR